MNHQMIDKHLQDINELGFDKTLILDTHDVAKILKVKVRTVVSWAKENIGPKCKKIGKSYIYTKRDIAEFLAQN
ncbi:helix-turn-helix domain-containing protein [Aliarcobacter butzleri]|uniref:helix-turn-helix domain-containing protein n=1 Tax=Aliarcobacter butzleri TaxID=28197 RepID=UPI00102DBEA9|nr:helix-turn-helix domain-containing protein [Aliarcobacter butzleri]RZV14529.1 DNA-binding protein [Aliarcobacter butzleri]